MIRQRLFQLYQRFQAQIHGAVYFLIASFFLLSLLSYHPSDPSFNQASDSQVLNWMGAAGAYVADPLFQFLGLPAFMLAVLFFIWSLRLFFRVPFRMVPLRLSCFVAALVAFSALLAPVSPPEEWLVFYVGFGGFLGDVLFDIAKDSLGTVGFMLLALVGFLAFSFIAFAMRVKEIKLAYRILRKTAYALLRVLRRGVAAVQRVYQKIRSRKTVEIEREAGLMVEEEPVEEEPIVEVKKKVPAKKAVKQKTLKLDENAFELPPMALLTEEPAQKASTLSAAALEQNAKMLSQVLEDFGVKGEITKVRPGPVVTLYELEPSPGTKSSRVVALADDIARSMSSISARIAVIPGRNVIGIELPNAKRETVYLRTLMETEDYQDPRMGLPIALGKDIGGESVMADLAKMPHLLIAGTTGSGKSVAVNAMILSFLYRLSPEDCRFIMIDPKMLELSIYDGIPHLLAPVVTEPGKAVVALKWAVREMENRYRAMSNLGVRNISGYNQRIEEAIKKGETLERRVQTGFDPATGQPIYETVALEMQKLPFIVVIVDEMADLMLTAGKEIESLIQRLAQMARAAGIHMVMATQRPSVDVITGVIKANFPTRISFQVTSRIDSRTILGEMGAEQLLGMGDMLYMAGGGRVTRVHGPFVDDAEVQDVVNHLKEQGEPSYVEEVTQEPEQAEFGDMGGEEASLYDQAVAIVVRDQKASTSYIQRQLRIGYNKAANLIEEMERQGVVSAANHAGKREILVDQ